MRVISTGSEGAICDHVDGEQLTPKVRQVFLCRENGPEDHERRVAEFQERKKKMAKSRANQKRAEGNAKVNQAFEQRAIDAQRELYGK